ncbi:MAG: PorP/SprF family type IX secretion system membrane protein [Bacteroidales bacterium]|nr:PorP/SprF family type IX secretion system membrane protein [Bacteroidales bacterium]
MKRSILFFLLLITVKLLSQEPPIYYHYLFNKSYINPAFTGSEMKAKVKVADMHSHLFKANMPNYQEIALSDRLGHHGLSWSIMSGKGSNLNVKAFQFSYAYHFLVKENRPYNNNTYLSVGVSALASLFIDDGGIQEGNPGVSSASSNSDLSPNLNTGAYLYNKDYYIGISAARFFPYPYSALESVDGENMNTPHVFTMGGYKFYNDDRKSYLEPSVVAIVKGNGNIATDAGLTASINKLYCISLMHRMIERYDNYNHYIVPAFVYNLRNYELGYSIDIPIVANDPYTFFHYRFYVSYTVAERCATRLKDCPAYW